MFYFDPKKLNTGIKMSHTTPLLNSFVLKATVCTDNGTPCGRKLSYVILTTLQLPRRHCSVFQRKLKTRTVTCLS